MPVTSSARPRPEWTCLSPNPPHLRTASHSISLPDIVLTMVSSLSLSARYSTNCLVKGDSCGYAESHTEASPQPDSVKVEDEEYWDSGSASMQGMSQGHLMVPNQQVQVQGGDAAGYQYSNCGYPGSLLFGLLVSHLGLRSKASPFPPFLFFEIPLL